MQTAYEVTTGCFAARIFQETASDGRNFTLQIPNIPMNVAGELVALRGNPKLDELEGFATFFVLADDTGSLAYATMEQQQIQRTRDWQPYEVQLALDPRATPLNLGVALTGKLTAGLAGRGKFTESTPFSHVRLLSAI